MSIELTDHEREARRLMEEACENEFYSIRHIISNVFIAKYHNALTANEVREIGAALSGVHDINKDALADALASLIDEGYLRQRTIDQNEYYEVNY